jgi:uncharacterized membrane protein YeaQ/YmgE (transglycosylase-associated protein family)
MEIPVLSGRTTTDEDSTTSAPVVVISQRLARLAFPHGDALGQAVIIGAGYLTEPSDLRPRTIVGIVADTREQGLRFAPTPTMYVPVAQSPEMITRLIIDKIPLRWVVRASGDASSLVPAVRQAVLSVDATQPPTDFALMSDVLARSIAPHRFNMIMLIVFGALALILAAVGVYGLTAYAVAQRTREIGIRVSLGASPNRLVRESLSKGLRLCLAGTIAGLIGAALLGPFLRSLLFGVSPLDGVSMAIVVATMIVVVLVATYLPAVRASRIDPMIALRHE